MADHTELRGSRRGSLEVVARVSDGCVETPAAGVDASELGIGLRTAYLWQPGTRVTVRLLLGDDTTAVARAVVERAEGDVMGLRFIAKGPSFSRLVGTRGAAA